MNADQVVAGAKQKFQQAVQHFEEELKKLRTGRAHPSMLDGVMVESYGTQMPLIQVASVTVPEPQLLQVTPYDPNNLASISAAIRDNQTLGLNPSDDGRVVRVQIPPLNEERRREFVKVLGGKVEDAMVSLRNVRHEAIKTIDEAKKDKDIGEDEAKRLRGLVDEALNDAKVEIESASKSKEAEIMKV